jgi:hypothetical protein
MAGHLANNVSILAKLVIAAYNTGLTVDGQSRDTPHGHAGIAQVFLLVMLLAGRLHEAHRLIGEHYFGKTLHEKCYGDMLPKSASALKSFMAYFSGTSNIISPLRKRFAFHFNREEVEQIYSGIGDEFPFTQYLSSEYHGHNLFFGNELIIAKCNGDPRAGSPNSHRGLRRVFRDTSDATEWLGLFVFGFIQVMLKRHILPKAYAFASGEIKIL